MSELTFDIFRQLAGRDFRLHLDDGRLVPMILAGCGATGGGDTSFSLTFRAGPDAPAEQATYLVSADGFGPAAIFLVPVARTSEPAGLEYQAVFNRAAGESAGAGQERHE
jgi:hypothetical protein